MLKHRYCISAFVLIVLAALLVSCRQSGPSMRATPTLLPPYQAIVQNAQADAQSTVAAGVALSSDLSLRATAVSLQITVAAATEQHYANATANARLEHAATQTAAAQQYAATRTTSFQSTSDAVNGISTQVALNELIRQDQRNQESQVFRTWAWRSALIVLFVTGMGTVLLLLVVAYKNRYFLLSLIGITRFGPDGRPYFAIPTDDGRVILALPDQAVGAAMEISTAGTKEAQVTGIGPFDLQREMNLLSGLTNLALAANTGGDRPGRAGRSAAEHVVRSAAHGLLNGTQTAYVVVRGPEDLPAHLRLGDDVVHTLNAQWKDVIDDRATDEPAGEGLALSGDSHT